jgi:hypothetical protein
MKDRERLVVALLENRVVQVGILFVAVPVAVEELRAAAFAFWSQSATAYLTRA